jgi:flagellar motor switch protein FliG
MREAADARNAKTMDVKNLPGSVKVAILLQSFGEEAAQRVLATLSEAQRATIQGHLAQMGEMSPPLVEKVAEEFTAMAGRQGTPQRSNTPKVEEKRVEENDSDQTSSTPASLNVLQSLEPDSLFELIKGEHPQTIATILTLSNTAVAGEILARLPDEVKSDVVLRVASLDKVLPEMVEEIDKVFEEVLKNRTNATTEQVGGIPRVAEILIQLDGATGDMIMSDIEESDPELAAQIKQRMFVFDDLILVDDKGMQKVLRKVETKELAIALKAASEEVREKVLKNMSERASEMLQEEIEGLGAVRMKEVEDAQQELLKIVQDMEVKGEIIISGRGGDDFVV